MEKQQKLALKKAACQVRMGVIEGTYHAKSGHPGGSLSVTDVLTYLYHCEMRHDPKNPHWPQRDRFVLSKGHCAPALYAVLAQMGYFPQSEIQLLRHTGEMLQGHPDMKHIPGVDMSTGSLGQGVSTACGMALSAKLSGEDYRVYTVLGDGEIEEGMVWEAFMFAAHRKLDNLVVIIDHNGLQIDGPITEVCSPEPIPEKMRAFGFHTILIDAHDFDAIEAALAEAKTVKGMPTAIVLESTKGKGVSYMENNVNWHGAAPKQAEYEQAMAELQAALAELEGE